MSFSLKKNAQFTARKMLRFGVYLTLFCLAGCNACQSIEDIERELNNGNDDPAVLVIETWGTEVRNALGFLGGSNNGFGNDCLGTADFSARVEIEVRTASFIDGQIVPDPDPYWEQVSNNINFYNNTGFNDGTQMTIEVPETGAYLLRYSLELDECSLCCHGDPFFDDRHCGDKVEDGKCEAGNPRLQYEKTFLSDDRPAFQYNHTISHTDLRVRSCVCSCLTNC